MSPRRMDISSLLRAPSPSPPHDDRHALPASLLSILNTPHSPSHRPPPQLRPPHPFLALDALVHVASEERRRISAVHDHVGHYRPHKRSRDSPRSPSPPPGFAPHPASPSTRHHPSASPTGGYPALRSQPVPHSEPSPASDARPPSLSLQHTSPFSHSAQLLTHSSPRNSSPHRHSPQLLRSQHPAPHPFTSTDSDAMSPRYGHGPRMAGGIEVLSPDPSPVRNPPRPDFSFYKSPRRDLSAERLVSDSYAEHARHEPPKLSSLFPLACSLDDDNHQVMPSSHTVEVQEPVFPRDRVRSRPHLPLIDATDCAQYMPVPAQHPPERHPIRVWEERPTPRRVSPVRVPSIVSGLTETRAWFTAAEGGYSEQPTKPDRTMMLQDVVENVPVVPLSTGEQQSPPRLPTPQRLTVLQTPLEQTCLGSPTSPPIPIQFAPQPHPLQTPRLNSPTPPAPASPVLDLPLRNFGTQPELQPTCSETRVDATASVSPMPLDPVVTEPVSDKVEPIHVCAGVNANLAVDPFPHWPVQSMPALEPASFVTSIHVYIPQSNRTSPRQLSPLVPLPAEEEHNPLSKGKLVSPSDQPAPRQSPELEHIVEREPPASEQAIMDVDEELLSLVEDRPARAVPAMPMAQADASSPLPTTQATGAGQPRETSDGPSLVPSSQHAVKGSIMTDEEKDRTSMPPPAARHRKVEKDKASPAAGAATGSKKKKDGALKSTAKPKQPPKPRAKPALKPKAKADAVDSSLRVGIPKSVAIVNARSRSTSVIPGTAEDVPEPEPEECDKEDDKLYCVCKTRYDEDRMMIACDRCDEWFHTMCVDVPDLEIDLVDQFICPPCLEKHPHLRTTWRRRCLFGLQHENPSSPGACHKPSRGAFSKYCSDECGIKSMQARIAQWEKSGGMRDLLWEGVKNAVKREGVVVCAATNGPGPRMIDADVDDLESKPFDSATKRRAEHKVTRLNARLEEVVKERELMKHELDMVMWRDKVVELASERAAKMDECGWDQRLCFGEEEWADFGDEVLESYEEERVKVDSGVDGSPLDAASAVLGEWWCTGKKKCERHAGWQKLRAAEVSFDKETKEGILLKLTTREREIRKCIEDILYPQPTGTLQAFPPGVLLNGSEKLRPTDKKGKKDHGRV